MTRLSHQVQTAPDNFTMLASSSSGQCGCNAIQQYHSLSISGLCSICSHEASLPNIWELMLILSWRLNQAGWLVLLDKRGMWGHVFMATVVVKFLSAVSKFLNIEAFSLDDCLKMSHLSGETVSLTFLQCSNLLKGYLHRTYCKLWRSVFEEMKLEQGDI